MIRLLGSAPVDAPASFSFIEPPRSEAHSRVVTTGRPRSAQPLTSGRGCEGFFSCGGAAERGMGAVRAFYDPVIDLIKARPA
ncbi:hypothetical protein BJF90_44655 [Pseudonocardia sp. CNS-004]|nr:hypothetical protein BJF90_44655 [Pseudonocardia sp. CNS-004]